MHNTWNATNQLCDVNLVNIYSVWSPLFSRYFVHLSCQWFYAFRGVFLRFFDSRDFVKILQQNHGYRKTKQLLFVCHRHDHTWTDRFTHLHSLNWFYCWVWTDILLDFIVSGNGLDLISPTTDACLWVITWCQSLLILIQPQIPFIYTKCVIKLSDAKHGIQTIALKVTGVAHCILSEHSFAWLIVTLFAQYICWAFLDAFVYSRSHQMIRGYHSQAVMSIACLLISISC